MDSAKLQGAIAKRDDEQQIAYGWAYVSERADGQRVVDHSGEFIELADLERAAVEFMLESRAGSDMHERTRNDQGEPIADVVESFVVTGEKLEAMGLDGSAVQKGWWVGVKVHDRDVWKRVQSGELSMFSIEGRATREPVD